MSKMSHRIFAGTMAAVFGISAVAFSAFVIYDMSQSRKTQEAQQKLTEAQTQQQASCKQSDSGTPLPAPEVYKAPAAVKTVEATDLEPGDGAAAKAGDCLEVKYYGTLANNGTMFDENFTQPTSFSFALGQGTVIKGWDEGLVGLKVNGTRRLVIPADKAYGPNGQGKIPANADLVFVVKLLAIKQ